MLGLELVLYLELVIFGRRCDSADSAIARLHDDSLLLSELKAQMHSNFSWVE